MPVNSPDHSVLTALALLGAVGWRDIAALAFGLLLVAADLVYSSHRFRRARTIGIAGIRAYLIRSFLTRLAILLGGMVIALRLFGRGRLWLAGAALILIIPANLILANKLGKSSGG